MKSIAFVALVSSTFAPCACTATRPEVETITGKVRGIVEGQVRVFRGIPFASPPLGKLRWAPPQPMAPWTGVRDASQYGNRCLQPSGDGAEDCLFLDVYSPSLDTHNQTLLPCLIWVHGGGYAGGDDRQNFTSLVSFHSARGTPVVVISVNYRLNIFGFLGSSALRGQDREHGSTGNSGIQDQRAAFQWVQANIAYFGGDREHVMIFGESAGGGSMTNHLVMPRSARLFSSVAIESGSFSSWTARPLWEAETIYQEVLNATGCSNPSCLLALPAANLSAVGKAVLPVDGTYCGPSLRWSPTVDGVELSAHPWDLLQQGRLNKVPVLHGTNRGDGAMFTTLPHNASASQANACFLKYFGRLMGKTNATEISAMYLQDSSSSPPGFEALESAIGDSQFSCPAHFASKQLSLHGIPVYQYFFTRGYAGHGYELGYVFMDDGNFPEEDKELATQMASYWYGHAAFGDPNRGGTEAGQPLLSWPRYHESVKVSQQYLQLDVKSKGGIRAIGAPYHKTQCDFMEEWTTRTIHETEGMESTIVVV
eukprot:TRINITY_DN1576_c0_g1_i1.p1 TRINITY_DN1576_c0_g1~~TRINITY_DN1576_c0_g1_i1.p1  ORF type:complete len:538 (-),score=63.33 TRINITY_DN1576_c0_g1_i1:53-1666(-)